MNPCLKPATVNAVAGFLFPTRAHNHARAIRFAARDPLA
jgi:hypothetical protein